MIQEIRGTVKSFDEETIVLSDDTSLSDEICIKELEPKKNQEILIKITVVEKQGFFEEILSPKQIRFFRVIDSVNPYGFSTKEYKKGFVWSNAIFYDILGGIASNSLKFHPFEKGDLVMFEVSLL